MTTHTETAVLSNPVPTYIGDDARKTELRQTPRLIDWLYCTAAARGQTKAEMASHLGVTFGYIRQLATGVRLVEQVSGEFCRACAEYLDIPPVAVMLAAGRITLSDFLMPEVERAPGWQLTAGLERIAADPLVGCLMPPEVWDAPDSVKQLLVALYEDATKQELMPTRQLPVLFRGLQDAAVVLAEADAFNDAARRIQDIAAWRA